VHGYRHLPGGTPRRSLHASIYVYGIDANSGAAPNGSFADTPIMIHQGAFNISSPVGISLAHDRRHPAGWLISGTVDIHLASIDARARQVYGPHPTVFS
jgi:hypothetical protein